MVIAAQTKNAESGSSKIVEREEITVRFCGDSGDGMQLAGTQMTTTSAIFGNDICTLPDFPAEIRAPAGSLAGVSGFQVQFGSHKLLTPGDRVNALIAMNPAALKTNIDDLEPGGVLLVNDDAFNARNLAKAGYESNPLDEEWVNRFQFFRIPMDKLNTEATKDSGLTGRAAGRCRNFFALGLVYWLYGRSLEPTVKWIDEKFGKKPAVADANAKALKAGYYFGETADVFPVRYKVAPAKLHPGKYRRITGNEATAVGMITAARLANRRLFYGSYPITPASDVLHELARYKHFGILTFQAEDEIAAITSTIGAAFAGALAATGTSGPGLALKGEGIGLAIMTELPMVILNVQRGGPSTGLPTKTEQADLNMAIWGRNSESPLCVLAASTPADCFHIAIEAFRIAIEYMTPVIMLSDGYLANGAEPWRIPSIDSLPKLSVTNAKSDEPFQPYQRNEKLARPWAIPGTVGLEHRIGGLEKQDITGDVCYEPENHEHMVLLRRRKIDKIAETIPPLDVHGNADGELLVLGWGSTFGSIRAAVDRCQANGLNVSSAHLRYLDPMPSNTGDVLRSFRRVLIPEMNLGQLATRIRALFLIDAISLTKVQGKPFMINEIESKIQALINDGKES